MTFQFKIQIKNITKPPVWRKVTVPAQYSFWDFHMVIQASFGWENSHLFSFSPGGWRSYPVIELRDDAINDPFFMPQGESLDAEKTMLSEIFNTERQTFTYIYDFGDNWEHKIILEKILPDKTLYPTCINGKGMCPPEDCGGVWGYMQLKEVLSDKNHPDYEEYKEWYLYEDQEKWDPSLFDLKETRKYVMQLFTKR